MAERRTRLGGFRRTRRVASTRLSCSAARPRRPRSYCALRPARVMEMSTAGLAARAADAAVLHEDMRPVFTLWRTTEAQHCIWVFQAEGGCVTQETADAYFAALRNTVARSEGDFVTLYDFTEPLSNFVPFALQLAKNAREIRDKMRPLRTVIVCPNATARNVMRLIIGMVGGDSPYVLVEDIASAWSEATLPAGAAENGVRDCYGTPLSAGLDPALMASAAVQRAAGG